VVLNKSSKPPPSRAANDCPQDYSYDRELPTSNPLTTRPRPPYDQHYHHNYHHDDHHHPNPKLQTRSSQPQTYHLSICIRYLFYSFQFQLEEDLNIRILTSTHFESLALRFIHLFQTFINSCPVCLCFGWFTAITWCIHRLLPIARR
jgi:hypothetical protein